MDLKKIAKEAFDLIDWQTGNLSGGIEAPRILIESNLIENKVELIWKLPETCGYPDCPYHNTDQSLHMDTIEIQDGIFSYNGETDPVKIFNISTDFFLLKEIKKFYKKWGLLFTGELMEKINIPYTGQDVYLEYLEYTNAQAHSYILLISEGAGDYFNLELYKKEESNKEPEEYIDVIGGGFMMREKPIPEEFYGLSVGDVIDEVISCNGTDDMFDIKLGRYTAYRIIAA